ncbi:DNA internalization-related competence protein ComEC/Rec2 [bacterium]|nr:DNA internalization-related competence protein ComEC/Rec2 [bacterium]
MTLFIQRPLVLVAGGALAGCVLGTQQCFSASPWTALAVAGVGLGLAWWLRQNIPGTLSIFCAVVALFYSLGVIHDKPALDNILHFGDRRDIAVQGRVMGFLQRTRNGNYWQGRLRCEKVRYAERVYTVSGSIRIIIPGPATEYSSGDVVSARGSLTRIPAPMNPGEFDYAAYLRQQGIFAKLRVYAVQDIELLQPVSRGSPRFWLQWLHCQWRQSIQLYVPEPEKNLILAMVLGIRAGLTPWQRNRIAKAGLAHILAISGMHVGIVFMLVLGCLKLARIPIQYAMLISLLTVFLYAGVTGAQVPVLRACIMLASMSLVYFTQRPADAFSGLALALILLLLQNPLRIYMAGFQLSFTATFAILVSLPWIQRLHQVKNRPGRILLQAVLISSVILVFIAPITLYHFYQFVPITILTNLPAVPLLGISMSAGLLLSLSAPLCPPLAALLGVLCAWAGKGMEGIACLAESIPGSVWYGGSPSLVLLALYYIFVMLVCWQKAVRRLSMPAMAGVVLVYLYLQLAPVFPKATRITFLSLGIGESALLESEDGKRILIDVGTEQEFFWRIRPFLAGRGIQSLDAVIISHADFDHAGGLLACLSFFQVEQIIHAQGLSRNKARRAAIQRLITRKNIASRVMYQDDRQWIGKTLCLEALWPPKPYAAYNNKFGLAVLVHTPGGRLLFPGDCPGSVETGWPRLPRVSVLKVGHHGDLESSADTFLAQIRPELAVICPGQNNGFGLPDQETVLRLQRWGAVVMDTAEVGAITVLLQPQATLRFWTW